MYSLEFKFSFTCLLTALFSISVITMAICSQEQSNGRVYLRTMQQYFLAEKFGFSGSEWRSEVW